jgi:tRNA threonylcarbamoyladenosine biosynthesis protein TsaB
MILAIDTSTTQAGVALLDEELLKGELAWVTAANHSTDLFVALDALWRLTGAGIESVTGVAVASGPGSFSGIRVGLSVGKAIAVARGIPLVAIPTFECMAASALPDPRVWCLLPAGRGQVYAALYRTDDGVERTGAYSILRAEDAAALLQPGDVVAGEGAGLVVEYLPSLVDVTLEGPSARLRRAGFLAELGRAYFESGGRDQTHEAEPLYLRRSAAEETRDARGG